jgi:NADPH-dependent 2,4-dienoyl-CoA reductase/sulfur reductase-like enzyme
MDREERKMINSPILIVGGGAAGMAAALSARKRLSELLPGGEAGNCITVLERESEPGGVLRQCVHHGFGLTRFSSDLTGMEYMQRFAGPFAASGISFLPDTSALEAYPDKTLLAVGPKTGRCRIHFEHLILASGCYERSFQSLTAAGTRPSGIYTAGEAQYLINRCHAGIGEEAVILGSGDMGQILARRMILEGKKVLAVIEKNSVCGGLLKNRRDCLEKYRIPVILSSTIASVHGEGRLAGVTVRNIRTKEEKYISCDTLISAVGLIPERRILKGLGQDGRLPDWISLCGNCHHVHKIVDSVTLQAEETGKAAAEKLAFSVLSGWSKA